MLYSATHYNTLQHSATRCNSDTLRSMSVSTSDEMYGCVVCDMCGGVCGVVRCLGCTNRRIMICCNLTSSLSAASSRAAHATSKKSLGTKNRNLFIRSRIESRRLGEASHFAHLPFFPLGLKPRHCFCIHLHTQRRYFYRVCHVLLCA